MLKNVLTYLKEGTIFNAIEVVDADRLEYHFLSMKKQKSELHIIHTNSFNSIQSIKSEIEKNTHVFLVINTKNILTKIIEAQKGEGLAVVNTAFPNLKTDDFYYETLRSGANNIVSICRKEEVDAILKNFTDQKIDVSGFSLGLSSINNILPFINDKGIQLQKNQIVIEGTSIQKIESIKTNTTRVYTINGIEIPSLNLLGFSEILGRILKSKPSDSNFDIVNSALKDEFLNKRFFNLFSKTALIGLLGILLINFLMFNHYFNKSEQLLQTSEINNLNKNKLLKLDTLVKIKEKMATDVLSTSSSKSSFYIDRISNIMPATLLLKELNYQPLKTTQIKENEIIEFDSDVILITGISTNSDDFSSWVENIEKFLWTDNVAIMDYDYSNRTSSLFTLQIKLNDE